MLPLLTVLYMFKLTHTSWYCFCC